MNDAPIKNPSILSRSVIVLFLVGISLLPWSWFPPFPWLHEHAQWSDLFFGLATVGWMVECVRTRSWPCWRPLHTALVAYGLCACVSWWMSAAPEANGWKLLGIAELVILSVLTSELLQRAGTFAPFARVVALTSLITAAAALLGLGLFYAGINTPLIGTYGDLVATPNYARVQAGTYQPNMLASFCIFAAAVTAQAPPSVRWRSLTQAALGLTVLLTFARGILGFALASLIRCVRTGCQRTGWTVVIVFAGMCAVALGTLTIWNLSFDPSNPFALHFMLTESSRWQALTTSLVTFAAHPLWGNGTGSSPGFYRGMPFDAHCTPLNLAATMGLPALIAFGAIFVLLWRQRRKPLGSVCWSGLAGLALDAMTQDIEDFRHLWVLIGLLDADSHREFA
jgi:hypothetical protein